jgi:processive 1,2-diacylglycerol beta-glucosyltransferase
MKTVLILSATAGAGHVRAAEALVATAKKLALPICIHHFDILEFTFPLFKRLYSDFYFAVLKASPELWGFFYKKSERKETQKPKPHLVKIFDQFNYKKYLATVREFKPSAILCTHFLPYAAIDDELRKTTWRIPIFSVPTDYDVHSLWVNHHVARYYVATEEAAWTVRSHGIPEHRITVTGIPVLPQFGRTENRLKVKKEFNLSPKRFTVMILSGGYGIGVIDKLVPCVAQFLASFKRKQFQMIVVCGKNQKLYDSVNRLRFPENVDVKLFQFVSFVDRLMNCADVLITKSGGLSVSEALAKHLPMIIFDPFPGQESRNADYLTEHGAAFRAPSASNVNFKLKRLIEQPALLRAMSNNAKKIAKPKAAEKIWEDVLKRI